MRGRLLAAQATAVGVALAICISYVVRANAFSLDGLAADMDAYWNAALRVRDGLPLYPPLTDVNASDVFRYPAWFALAWVPLTLLPKAAVTLSWVALMTVAAAASVLPALRRRSVAGLVLALLMSPILVEAAWLGNVEPLLVAGLVWGLGTRAEAPAIALAAATKLTPIAFLAVPLARRDVTGAAVAAGIIGLLLLPMLLFDVSEYPVAVGGTLSLWMVGPAWWAVVAATSLVWLGWAVWRRSRLVALAAAVASLSLPPRVNLLNVPQLLAGDPEPSRATDGPTR